MASAIAASDSCGIVGLRVPFPLLNCEGLRELTNAAIVIRDDDVIDTLGQAGVECERAIDCKII